MTLESYVNFLSFTFHIWKWHKKYVSSSWELKESIFVKCLSFYSLQCLFITLLVMCKVGCVGIVFGTVIISSSLPSWKPSSSSLQPSTICFPMLSARYYLLFPCLWGNLGSSRHHLNFVVCLILAYSRNSKIILIVSTLTGHVV